MCRLGVCWRSGEIRCGHLCGVKPAGLEEMYSNDVNVFMITHSTQELRGFAKRRRIQK